MLTYGFADDLLLEAIFGRLSTAETDAALEILADVQRAGADLAADLSDRLAPRTCPTSGVYLTVFTRWGEAYLQLSLGGSGWPGGIDVSVSNRWEDDEGRYPAPPFQINGGIAIHCVGKCNGHGGVHNVWDATELASTPLAALEGFRRMLDLCRERAATIPASELAGELH